jgi:hypothetical protein
MKAALLWAIHLLLLIALYRDGCSEEEISGMLMRGC